MKNQTNIYTELSNKYGVPRQVIEVICNSPFKFTNEVMSRKDPKPVMLAYIGKIRFKKRYLKKFQDEREKDDEEGKPNEVAS